MRVFLQEANMDAAFAGVNDYPGYSDKPAPFLMVPFK